MYKVELDSAIEMEVAPTTSAADVLKETMAYHHITQTDFAAHIACLLYTSPSPRDTR